MCKTLANHLLFVIGLAFLVFFAIVIQKNIAVFVNSQTALKMNVFKVGRQNGVHRVKSTRIQCVSHEITEGYRVYCLQMSVEAEMLDGEVPVPFYAKWLDGERVVMWDRVAAFPVIAGDIADGETFERINKGVLSNAMVFVRERGYPWPIYREFRNEPGSLISGDILLDWNAPWCTATFVPGNLMKLAAFATCLVFGGVFSIFAGFAYRKRLKGVSNHSTGR